MCPSTVCPSVRLSQAFDQVTDLWSRYHLCSLTLKFVVRAITEEQNTLEFLFSRYSITLFCRYSLLFYSIAGQIHGWNGGLVPPMGYDTTTLLNASNLHRKYCGYVFSCLALFTFWSVGLFVCRANNQTMLKAMIMIFSRDLNRGLKYILIGYGNYPNIRPNIRFIILFSYISWTKPKDVIGKLL